MSLERGIQIDPGSDIADDAYPESIDIDVGAEIDIDISAGGVDSMDDLESEEKVSVLLADGDRKGNESIVLESEKSNRGGYTGRNENRLKTTIGSPETNEKAPTIDLTLQGDTTTPMSKKTLPVQCGQESNEETMIAGIVRESMHGRNERLVQKSELSPTNQALGPSGEEIMELEGIRFESTRHHGELPTRQQPKKELWGAATQQPNMGAMKQEEKIKFLPREATSLGYGHNFQPLDLKQQQLKYQLQQQQQQQQQNRQVQFLLAQKQAMLQGQFHPERCGALQIGYNTFYDPSMANPQGFWPGTYAVGTPDARARLPEATIIPLAPSSSPIPVTTNAAAAYTTTQRMARIEHLQMLKRSKEEKFRFFNQKLNRLTQEIQEMERLASFHKQEIQEVDQLVSLNKRKLEELESTTNSAAEEQRIPEINEDLPVSELTSTDTKPQDQQETGNETPIIARNVRTKQNTEIGPFHNEYEATENDASSCVPTQEHRSPKPPVEHQTLKLETGLPIDGLDSMFRSLQRRSSHTGNPSNRPPYENEPSPSMQEGKPEPDTACGSDTDIKSNKNNDVQLETVLSSPQRVEEIVDQQSKPLQQLPPDVDAILKRMERSCRNESGTDDGDASEKEMLAPSSPIEVPCSPGESDSLRDYVTTLVTDMNEDCFNSPNTTSLKSFLSPPDSKRRPGEKIFPEYPSDLDGSPVGDDSSVESDCNKYFVDSMGSSNAFVDPFSPQQDVIPLSSTSSDEVTLTHGKSNARYLAAHKPIEPFPSNSKRPECTDLTETTPPRKKTKKQETDQKPSSSLPTPNIVRSSSNVKKAFAKKTTAKKPSTRKKSPLIRRAKTPTKKQNDKWMAYYRLLIRYKQEQNGSTDVPRHYKDKKLGCWVKHQRDKYRLGVVLPERVRLLDELGFHWTVRTRWNDMFQQLVEYKNRFGDTRVLEKKEELLAKERSERTPNDGAPSLPPLRFWVFRQRYMYKWGKLTEQRIKKLSSIGFQWDGNKADKKDEQRFKEKFELQQHLLQQQQQMQSEASMGAKEREAV